MSRAHAELAPSASARWMACPGSIRMSRGVPRFESEYAAEGTAAHEVAEICLKRNIRPSQLLDKTVKGFVVDFDMAAAVQVYVDYVLDAQMGALSYSLERWVTLDSLNPPAPMGGYIDCDILRRLEDEPGLELEVIDYKHGKGVWVSPVRNPQAMYYALAAMIAQPPQVQRELKRIKITIIQPRADNEHGLGIKTWTCTPADLHTFVADLFMAAVDTMDPEAPLNPGEHCRFCPALPQCPAVANSAVALAQATFADEIIADEPPEALHAIKPAGGSLTASTPKTSLSAALAAIDAYLDNWIAAVKSHALNLLEAAEEVPGYKLVDKRSIRSWKDEAAAEEWLRKVAKLKVSEIRPPGKMISPAKAEEVVGKGSVPGELVKKVSSGHTIAPVSDNRPQAVPDLIMPVDGGDEFFAD